MLNYFHERSVKGIVENEYFFIEDKRLKFGITGEEECFSYAHICTSFNNFSHLR